MSIWNRITARWKRRNEERERRHHEGMKAIFDTEREIIAKRVEARNKREASVALAKRKQEFVDNYVAVYLATYAAANHDDACMRGEHKRLESGIEDAHYLAQKAWEDLQELER